MSTIEASDNVRRSAELSMPPNCASAPLIVEHRLIEQQRVGDAVAHEGVDFEPLVLRDQHFLALVVEGEDALVDIDDRVDERHAA